jgi:anti-anti-sigma factor
MQSTVETRGRRVALSGALDLETAAELEALVLRFSADGTDVVILDLRKLTHIDVLGVRAVVFTYAICDSDGFDFWLIPGSTQVERVIARCGAVYLLPSSSSKPIRAPASAPRALQGAATRRTSSSNHDEGMDDA